ncbi:hypothetical protein [Sporofaciens musculi]|jgi:mannose-6-phosphate isomerase-like protein (cupin superfamily)|uniref:hypothetical protein n=1 Tax=Sporofaciens musculi TaxID=2681861 RepID=UPI0021700E18|nr:hypothetical protein [Sporofaciens musculi]MCI9423783.1 hypothetical protein [Dorea sp.]
MPKNSLAKTDAANRTVFSGAHDYFANNVLPENVSAHLRRIRTPMSYTNNRDQTFFLVRSGTGTIDVNGLEYKLRPNTLINLGPFHRYRLLPSRREELEVAEARMNSGTYMYMVANPYLKYEHFSVPSQPPVVYLRGLSAQIANDSMNGLLSEAKSDTSDGIQLCFCYMMNFLGIITDHMEKDFFSPVEKKSK